jgi:hypothetical protein
MAPNIDHIGTPSVCNRAFLPLAIEAGIEETITSLIPLAMDKRSLLKAVVEALWEENRPLAEALNIDTLDAVLAYIMSQARTPIVFACDLPTQLNRDGPASVSAARDGGTPAQVNVTCSEDDAPTPLTRYAIYLDGIFARTATYTPDTGWVNDSVLDVPEDARQHTIRVLFVDDDLAITRFGPVATFT